MKLSADSLASLITNENLDGRMDREDDPTDIATDEEAGHRECNCIIHSGGRRIMREEGYMLSYKLNGQEG